MVEFGIVDYKWNWQVMGSGLLGFSRFRRRVPWELREILCVLDK